jgi:CheY-like chemotaxis protein
MVIDDEPEIVEILREFFLFADIFEQIEVQTVTGQNVVQEACELISLRKPDIILTDWNMPCHGNTEGGAEVIKAALGSGIPPEQIAVMTGSGISQEQREANFRLAGELGVTQFFGKPFKSLEELHTWVSNPLPSLAV